MIHLLSTIGCFPSLLLDSAGILAGSGGQFGITVAEERKTCLTRACLTPVAYFLFLERARVREAFRAAAEREADDRVRAADRACLASDLRVVARWPSRFNALRTARDRLNARRPRAVFGPCG